LETAGREERKNKNARPFGAGRKKESCPLNLNRDSRSVRALSECLVRSGPDDYLHSTVFRLSQQSLHGFQEIVRELRFVGKHIALDQLWPQSLVQLQDWHIAVPA